MSHGQGAQQGAQQMSMSRSSAPPLAFMQQLMVLVDPHQPERNDALHTAQSACGRWIGLRRLHQNLSKDVLARMLDITADQLLLLETGLATPDLISEAARENLSLRLASNAADRAWAADVIAIALGRIQALNEPTLDRVFNDLEIASMDPEKRDQMLTATLVLQPEPNQEALPEPLDRELLQRYPEMYSVLGVVINGARDIHAALERLRKDDVSIGLLEVGVLLNHMQRERLLVVISEQPDPAYPDEITLTYQATPRGLQTFNAERSRQVVFDAKRAAEKQKQSISISRAGLLDSPG